MQKEIIVNSKVLSDMFKKIKEEYKSMKNFANIAQIPYTTLRDMFVGDIRKSNVENVIKVCKLLNVDINTLYSNNFDLKTIQQRMLYCMTKNSIQAQELSFKTDINEIRINGYILAKIDPEEEELQKIAEALNVSYNYLTGDDEEERIKLLARKMGKLDENKFRQALKVIDAMIDNFEEEQAKNGDLEK